MARNYGGPQPPGNHPVGYAPSAPAQQYLPPAPKKRSPGRRILSVLVAIVLVVGVRVGVHTVMDRHDDHRSNSGLDYAIGTCLDLSKAGGLVKPSDVHAAPCSSPTALAKVAAKYNGTKNCPNGNYGTLDSAGSGLCLQDNLTVGSCYRQTLLSHMFALSGCTRGFSTDPTFRVALRRDGVDDPGLCNADQQAVDFPQPALTYCLDVLVLA